MKMFIIKNLLNYMSRVLNRILKITFIFIRRLSEIFVMFKTRRNVRHLFFAARLMPFLIIALFIFNSRVLSAPFIMDASCSSKKNSNENDDALSESSRMHNHERRIAELSYKTAGPVMIRSIIITPPAGIERQKQVQKIEILTSEFDTPDDTYWLSSGIFELSETAETTVCEFDPIDAQYIKIRILQCRGGEIHYNIGKVTIGLNTFKLTGGITDSADGAPVRNAGIYVNGEKLSVSNQNGDFIIEKCPYGTLEIVINADGYHYFKETAPVFDGKKISMAFKMKKHSYALCGRVTDIETGQAVALASISIAPAGVFEKKNEAVGKETIEINAVPSEIKTDALTDEFGFYHFENLSTETYEIKISAEDYGGLSKTLEIKSGKKYVVNFVVRSKRISDSSDFSNGDSEDANDSYKEAGIENINSYAETSAEILAGKQRRSENLIGSTGEKDGD